MLPLPHHNLLLRGNQCNSFISACGRLQTATSRSPSRPQPPPRLSPTCPHPSLLPHPDVPTSRDQRTVADLHTLSCTATNPRPLRYPSGLLKVRSSDLEIPYWTMHACTHMCVCFCESVCVCVTPLRSSGSQGPGSYLGFGKRGGGK